MKIHTHAGREIQERVGLAGQVAYTVIAGPGTYFQLVGSEHGTPGPVVLIVGGMESHVNAAYRFGDTFDAEYVKRWIDSEDAARAALVTLRNAGPIGIVCTTCNAGPGKRCTQPTETGRRDVSWFHGAREDGLTWS